MLRAKPALRDAWAASLALLLLLTAPAQAAAPDPAASGASEIVLRVQTPAYTHDASGVRVAGYTTNDVPGAPALPVWGTVVELPAAGAWSVAVEPGRAELIARPSPLPAAPVPQPVVGPLGWGAEWPDAVAVADQPDPAIYGADAFYPTALVQAGGVQWQRGRRLLALRVFPFQYNPVAGILRYYPDIRITVRVEPGAEPAAEAASQLQPGVANPWASAVNPAALAQANGGALRIRTGARGMYGLTYNDLVTAGVPITTTDPATFGISYLGQAVDIRLIQAMAGQFGPGDRVVFYAEPYQGRYLNHNVYWFTYGGTGSTLMATRTVTPDPAAPLVTEITRTLHIENDLRYMSAIGRPKDVDHWFDVPIGQVYAPISYTLALSDTVLSGELTLRAFANSGGAQGTNDRSIALRLNDHDAGTYAWSGLTDYLAETAVPASWLDTAPNQVGLWPGTGVVYPDWIEATYGAQARAYGDALYIEGIAPGANEVVVSGFSAADVTVYDVRAARHPVVIAAPPAQWDGASYVQHFWDADLAGPTYYLSTDGALAAPPVIERAALDSTPTPLLSVANQADYIAIVHRSLWAAIDPLLAHRRANDHFTVAKVDVQQIYDEFSYGRRDPEAIRSFLSYAYHTWKGPTQDAAPPQYVVLVGSGTYDFTGVGDGTKPNLVPPYLLDIDPWIGETAADNRYVSVDGADDFLPDMAVGRIPAQTPADVTAVVDKVLAYETAAQGGAWQRRAVYVADNCTDGAGDFHWLSDQTRLGWLPAAYDDRTLYYGDVSVCPQSYANTASGMQAGVRAAFDGGAFMLQWFGHAGRSRWGTPAEYPPGQLPIYLFSSNVVPALNANTVWPITFAYACWSGYFINLAQPWYVNYMDETVGEALVVTPGRGSVADVSPSGQHIGGSLVVLNQGMTNAIFLERNDRMGLAVDAGKQYYFAHAGSFLDVIDTSILFGDPATRLRLPPIASIARNETTRTTVTLRWQHVPQYTRYEVWRSTVPYFQPGDPGSEQRGEVAAPTVGEDLVFDDAQAIGAAAANHFYVIRGINAYGSAGISNRVGAFNFALMPGN